MYSSDTNFNLSADVRARGVAPERPASPSRWWREVCPIAGTRLVISGDLPGWGTQFGEHLQRWVTAGVTHIIDVRDEWNDANAVRELAPAIVYHWLGTDDDGYGQPDAWFDAGVDAALDCMADPTAVAMIHCHMGVNRGPSMAFAVLLAMGWHPVAAIEATLQVHGGYGFDRDYDVVTLWPMTRLLEIAPINNEMLMNYIGEHVLGLPKSY